MANIPQKPVIENQIWINGQTKLNQTNLTNGVNQNITNLKTAVDGIIDALGGAGGEPASDKTLNQTTINDYSAATTYTDGQVVKYNGKYYRCKVASSQGVAPTDTTKWAQIALSTPVDSALDEDSTNPVQNAVVAAAINDLEGTDEQIIKDIAPAYDSATVYKSGVLLTYNQKLYECIKDATAGTLPTNTTYFKEVTVKEELDGKITFGSDWFDGSGSVHYAEEAGLAEGIATDRTIDNPEDSCPPITFGTVGGEAEIQTGINPFKYMEGASQKWNQLYRGMSNTRFGLVATVATDASISITGIYDGTSQYENFAFSQQISWKKDRKYIVFKNKIISGKWGVMGFEAKNGDVNVFIHTYHQDFQSAIGLLRLSNGDNINITGLYVSVVDLTAIDFNTSGTDGEIIARFKAQYPLSYYAYSAGSIKDVQSDTLISRGRQQWDEQWELGDISTSTGADASSTTRIRSATNDFTRVIPGASYYVKGVDVRVYFYNASKGYINCSEFISNGVCSLPSDCYYIRIVQKSTTTYNHDITISVFFEDGEGYDQYYPYEPQTIQLPNIPLRSVPDYTNGGEIKDIAYQAGGGKRKIGVYTFTGNETWLDAGTHEAKECSVLTSLIDTNYLAASIRCPSLCQVLSIGTYNDIYNGINSTGIGLSGNGKLITKSSNVSLLTGKKFYYILKDETDISLEENPGWTELLYTDNYGTLEFTSSVVPQVPQPYFIEYTISLTEWVDSAYTRTGGDANEIALQSEVDKIVDGNTPVGKALLADNLESTQKTEVLSPYIMRQSPTGVGASMLLDHLTGATIAWNQLVQNGNFANGTTNWLTSNASVSVSSGVATITASAEGGSLYQSDIPCIVDHKYLFIANIKLTTASANTYLKYRFYGNDFSTDCRAVTTNQIVSAFFASYGTTDSTSFAIKDTRSSGWDAIQIKNVQIFDLTQMFGPTIANYLYNQGSAGADKFLSLFPKPYYPYNAGELVGIKTAGRKAVGVNQFDGEVSSNAWWSDAGKVSTPNYDCNTNLIEVLPNTTYYYKADATSSYLSGLYMRFYDKGGVCINPSGSGRVLVYNGNTFTTPSNAYYLGFFTTFQAHFGSNPKFCINISDSNINGTFYPYEADEYPCEEVELNGLYSLDANNNIVAVNGDTYSNDGTLTRKYGSYTFTGDETYTSVGNSLRCAISGIKRSLNNDVIANILCNGFVADTNTNVYNGVNNYSIAVASDSDEVRIYVSGYGPSTIGALMKGKTLIYELATPTEETATSFASTQRTGVTEQFMEPETPSTVFLPVGNDSFYLPDLKGKLEVSPDSPITDGVYVVSRTGGSNVYISIADVTATQSEIDEIIDLLQ